MKIILNGTVTSEDATYLTLGREYKVDQYSPANEVGQVAGAWILDDDGDSIFVLVDATPGVCCHAGGDCVFNVVEE